MTGVIREDKGAKDRVQHGLSSRVAKDHFALHLPWELLPQGEFVEGGGLECGYEDGDQLDQEHHQWVCESRVGTNGGGGRGGARRL